MLALDRLGCADKVVARQGRRDHAVHRGRADLVALVPAAIDQELQRAGRLAAGNAKRGDDLLFRQTKQFRRSGRRPIRPGGRGGMKAAGIMRGRIERIAEPAADLVACDDSGQYFAARRAYEFADRERGRHYRRARMQRGIRMGVVEIERMAERAVEQRGDRRRPGPVVAKHGRLAAPIQRKRLQRLEQRGRRFRITPRPDGAAEKIERQRLGALAYFFGDVFETKIGDISGKRCGFLCHSCSLWFLFGLFWRDCSADQVRKLSPA